METSKKIAGGFFSFLAWVVLLAALFITSANLVVSNLSHAGESATSILKQVSAQPEVLNSLLDEVAKGADPELAAVINKNRAQINESIVSLSTSPEFTNLLAATLDQISQAALSGAPSVKLDFSKLATFVADKVNASAKQTIIKTQDVASLKPTVVDLGNASTNITDIKKKLKLALSVWILWVALLLCGFALRGRVVLRTAGIQLITVGAIGLFIRFGAPVVFDRVLNKPDISLYQQKAIPEVFATLASPILALSSALTIVGIVLTIISLITNRAKVVSAV